MLRTVLALLLLIPLQVSASLQDTPDEYLRLTFELVSSSDKVSLYFDDATRFLTARHRPTGQDPENLRVNMHGLFYEREEELGRPAVFKVDYALKGINKGKLGMRLQSHGEPVELKVYDNSGRLILTKSAPGDGREYPLKVDVNGIPFTRVTEEQKRIITDGKNRERMIWAFYYVWYKEEWTEAELIDSPTRGKYTSYDEEVMEQHIDEAIYAGLDGFIVSWWGPESYSDDNLKKLLKIAERKNFKIQIYFESAIFREDGPETLEKEKIYEYLKYLISTYKDHPSIYKIDNKPVIPIYLTFLKRAQWWKPILDDLKNEGHQGFYIGDFMEIWTNLDVLEVFDGMHNYNPLNVVRRVEDVGTVLRDGYRLTGEALKFYPLLNPTVKAKLWAPSIIPGYDDSEVDGRLPLIFPRGENGALYKQMFDIAIETDANWVCITSWNEWWEQSCIEPSIFYGRLFLDITRNYSIKWRRNRFQTPPE